MPLTETALRALKPTGKTRKVADERGLYLEISPAGGKWWRIKYRIHGKEKRLSLGVYPDVGLKQARERRDEARRLLAEGIDPGERRKAEKQTQQRQHGDTLEALAREWYALQSPQWAQSHQERTWSMWERWILPGLGHRPIAGITAPELLEVMRRIEATTVSTAHRALGDCGRVFRFAISSGRAVMDPTPALKQALKPFAGYQHFAATLERKRLGEILRAIDGYSGMPVTCAALRLAPLVFVRPGELRRAEWAEFDLEAAQWEVPSSRMKMRKPHLVPLSPQAVVILRELYRVTGQGLLAFPGTRQGSRPISDMTLLNAMRKQKIGKEEMTTHGFRAVARTLLDEELGFRPDIIEHQLGHAVRDPNGRAYNRTSFLPERRQMMQAWADYLDKLKG